jgi:hypothetical protein
MTDDIVLDIKGNWVRHKLSQHQELRILCGLKPIEGEQLEEWIYIQEWVYEATESMDVKIKGIFNDCC